MRQYKFNYRVRQQKNNTLFWSRYVKEHVLFAKDTNEAQHKFNKYYADNCGNAFKVTSVEILNKKTKRYEVIK